MTREETKQIMTKIKNIKQEFSFDASKIDDWTSVLKNYDFEDVFNKVEDYYRIESNQDKIVNPYYLTKYLMTTADKKSIKEYLVICPNCQTQLSSKNFDKHIKRCNSVEYLNKQSKRFFGKEIDREKYMTMSEEEFEEKYLMTLELIREKGNDEIEKKRIENIKRTMLGGKVEFTPEMYIKNKEEDL